MTDTTNRQPGRPLDPTRMFIPPGLTTLPRQIGIFPAFRAAMLESASTEIGLGGAGWRGRDVDDFGVMLIEMWAYVCDVLSFYDSFTAGEGYLRTATRMAAARRLVNLIGYIPRPAVAAVVDLALTLDGRVPVTIPADTAFRSGSFDDEKPQVFTLLDTATRHPLAAKFTLVPQFQDVLSQGSVTSLTFKRGTVSVKEGDVVLVKAGSGRAASIVSALENTTDAAGNRITRVSFTSTLKLPAGTPYSQITLHTASNSPGIYYQSYVYVSLSNYSHYTITGYLALDSTYKHIKIGDIILVKKDDFVRWYKVTNIGTTNKTVSPSSTISSTTGSTTTTTTIPAVTTPVTALTLDAMWDSSSHRAPEDTEDWDSVDQNSLTVYSVLTKAGTAIGEAPGGIGADDGLKVSEPVPVLADDYQPAQFILEDLDKRAVLIDGALANDGTLTVASSSAWSGDLVPPVRVHGALVRATRGEKVSNEMLGVGDGSMPNQTFKLKKKPLTYLSATTDSGVMSTLEVYVDNIRWTEAARFYGRAGDESIYIVRQNADGDSFVTFGDGVHGARLNSGAVVVAHYYFGAGAAAPPAGLVNQMVTPVKSLTTVTNPLPAFGGADPEDETGIKQYAPRSAMMLGRAVSLVDYEAVAASTTGVIAAAADWRWSETQQRPVVSIQYIGAGDLGSLIRERLTGYSAEGVAFEVTAAEPVDRAIHLALVVDADYVPEVVADDVIDLLTGEDGALLPQNVGMGKRVIRSQILALVATIPGVVAALTISVNGFPMPTSLKPPPGKYFDITLTVTTETAV